MKTRTTLSALTLALSMVFVAQADAAGKRQATYVAPFLSVEETADLTYMREEEKLARDVYLTLHESWGSDVFANIAESEQKHTETIENLLDKYKLIDPVVVDQRGVFVDATLQNLYDTLIQNGSQSLTAALRVGALIEETDIRDIQEAISRTDEADIIAAYENLMKGSRNHLRAFVSQLENVGVIYEAQVLDQQTLDAIVDSPVERGAR